MRQYRGRIKDSTVWVYGYYTKSPQGIARIWSPITKENGESYLYDYVVDPETVGQYTGLKDKNGKEIYEGDILEVPHDDGAFYLKVAYDEELARYWFVDELDDGCCYAPDEFEVYEVKVVGNIYENPELLKGDESE